MATVRTDHKFVLTRRPWLNLVIGILIGMIIAAPLWERVKIIVDALIAPGHK